MDKHFVLQTLRAHQSELRAAGITRLSLFGSVARGESTPQSDVDLIADFDFSKRLSLLSMVRLEDRLAALLGVKVDLAPADSLKVYVQNDALREALHVF